MRVLGTQLFLEVLGPDDSFSIEEILNHFDAVPDLNSSTFRHRKNSAKNFARLHIVE